MDTNETVLVTGGTGLVGKALTRQLCKEGYRVIILSRHIPAEKHRIAGVKYVVWDIAGQQIDDDVVKAADHIIHLAGAGVMEHKWTAAYKKMIIDSRTKSSELIIAAMKRTGSQVKSFVSASAIGWYGPDKDPIVPFTETDGPYNNFLGETCRLWEESVNPVSAMGVRLVKWRIGIVLSNDGGAFIEFKGPLKFHVAVIMGSGKQVMSWIHIDDLCRLFIEAIKSEKMSGVYNAVTPEPVSNRAFMKKLAKKTKNWFIPAPGPAFILKLMLGGRSIEILKSATVSCEKLLETGFQFSYPTMDAALDELCKK